MSEIASKDRMIAAAVILFSKAGFNGVTTKDIARCANVSEGNIFRYFPSKRDLFFAAIDTELAKLSVRVEMLAQIPSTASPRAALQSLFELIIQTVVSQPEMVRLMRYGTLDFGPEMEPIYRRHLDAIVTASAKNFEKWSGDYGFRDLSARVTVMSFVAIVMMLQNYPLLTGSCLPFPSVESAAAAYAELWYRVLSVVPPGRAGSDLNRLGDVLID